MQLKNKSKNRKPRSAPVDRLFRAFSDPTRLRILGLLHGGEKCVCDVVDAIGAPQPTISRHLSYLRKSGLVTVRKQGLWSYYALDDPKNEVHARLLDCLACCGQLLSRQKSPKRGKACAIGCCS